MEKLSLSQEILRANEQVISMLQESSDHDISCDDCGLGDLHRLSKHTNKIQRYIKTATALVYRAERTSILVSLFGLEREAIF